MSLRTLLRGAAALLVLLSLACASSPSEPEAPTTSGTASSEVVVTETPDGVMLTETVTITATVIAVDAATRAVRVRGPEGRERVIEAGPQVRNFDQIDVGDQLRVTLLEEIAITVDPTGSAPGVAETSGMAVAAKGDRPGAVMADTITITARVVAIDHGAREIALEEPDGTVRTVKVGPRADLQKVRPGDSLQFQLTEAIAIGVEEIP